MRATVTATELQILQPKEPKRKIDTKTKKKAKKEIFKRIKNDNDDDGNHSYMFDTCLIYRWREETTGVGRDVETLLYL